MGADGGAARRDFPPVVTEHISPVASGIARFRHTFRRQRPAIATLVALDFIRGAMTPDQPPVPQSGNDAPPPTAPAHHGGGIRGSLARRILRAEWELLSEEERAVIERVAARIAPDRVVARDINRELSESRSLGERVSDNIASFGGSWTFILIFIAFLIVWTIANTVIQSARKEALDPYPFIFLNLLLSMIAALQAPVIMMSQNRAAKRDRLAAKNDYEVNLKAELEIRELHEKLDVLREAEWAELVRMQQDQIRLLEQLIHPEQRAEGGPGAVE